MYSQSGGKERIGHDSFYIQTGEKSILASENEKKLFKKIYNSRTPLPCSHIKGVPPAPRFSYSSEVVQKSFTVYPTMMWIDLPYSPEIINGEEIRYFEVDSCFVEAFLSEVRKRNR